MNNLLGLLQSCYLQLYSLLSHRFNCSNHCLCLHLYKFIQFSPRNLQLTTTQIFPQLLNQLKVLSHFKNLLIHIGPFRRFYHCLIFQILTIPALILFYVVKTLSDNFLNLLKVLYASFLSN